MKSTVVNESLSSTKPMYCSREYFKTSRLIQQYEKSTLKFFVVLGNGSALTGMSDTELLDIMSVQCNTLDTHHTDRDSNTQQAEEECYIIKISNHIFAINIDNNNDCTVDYFLPVPNRDANKRADAKLIKSIHSEFDYVLIFRNKML